MPALDHLSKKGTQAGIGAPDVNSPLKSSSRRKSAPFRLAFRINMEPTHMGCYERGVFERSVQTLSPHKEG